MRQYVQQEKFADVRDPSIAAAESLSTKFTEVIDLNKSLQRRALIAF